MSHINFNRFKQDERGLAIVEAALLIPLLITLTFGIYDLGNALVLNQKVITAAQIAGDLLGRERSVDTDELTQASEAARLALDPYDKAGLGIDIIGVKFDSEDAPYECWRHTSAGMTENTVSIDNAEGLGVDGEGVIIVTTKYKFTPYFSSSLLGTFDIEEVAFIRGRKTPFIPHEGVSC